MPREGDPLAMPDWVINDFIIPVNNMRKFDLKRINAKKAAENDPVLWNHILENVREIYGCDACIAGGAVRDYFLGVREKDIDVFVDVAYDDVITSSTAELNFGPAIRTDHGGNEYKTRDPKIVGTWEFYHKGVVINLIAKPLPVEDYVQALLDTFDFEICKSAYFFNKATGEYEIYDSSNAKCDREDKTFTYVGPEDNTEQSFRRLERFNQRTGLNFRSKGLDRVADILKAKKEAKKEADEKRRVELNELANTA